MANYKNLKSFKPGQEWTGNKDGRPKGSKSMSTILRDILNSEIDINDPIVKKRIKSPIKYALILKLVQKGLNGDRRAITDILDREMGKPAQTNINLEANSAEDAESIRDFLGVNGGN